MSKGITRKKICAKSNKGSGGSGSGPALETNGVPNGSQVLLNLVEGVNTVITDDGLGNITIDASGSGVMSVDDDANGVVSVDNTDPANPIIEFNGVNVDGLSITGDGTSGTPLKNSTIFVQTETGGHIVDDSMGTTTLFGTGIGSLTLPADIDGTTYRIQIGGVLTTGSALDLATFEFVFALDGNTIATTGASTLTGSQTDCWFKINIDFTVIDSASKVWAVGDIFVNEKAISTTSVTIIPLSITTAQTADFTSTIPVDVTLRLSGSSGAGNNSCTSQTAYIQKIN